MKGFVQDIEDLAVKNDEFRRVIYTAKHCREHAKPGEAVKPILSLIFEVTENKCFSHGLPLSR